MKEPIKHRATLNVIARTDEGVERSGDSRAPTAFRIWRAGENKCDDGSIFFTEESAKKLIEEQASKNRPLSIDFDHLSLANDRAPEAGRAAGWHQLEARDTDKGPELWAVNVEWSPDVRAGLEEEPPRWRFFSPAFYTDEEKQVTSYINLAICINPMTHGIPMLASTKFTKETPTMTAEEQLSALDAIIAATDDADTKATLQAIRDSIASDAADEGELPAKEAPAAASAGAEATTHAEGDDDGDEDKDKKKKDDEADKKSVKTHAAKALDPAVASLAAKVVELERRAEVGEIDALLAKHANLPDEFRAHCRKGSLADARVMIKTVVGVKTHSRKEVPSQGSTKASALDPRDADFMDRSMGMKKSSSQMPYKTSDGRLVIHSVGPSELVRMNAQKAKI